MHASLPAHCPGRLPLKLVVEVCVRRLATLDEKNEIFSEKPQDTPLPGGRPRNTLLNIMLIIGTLRDAGRKGPRDSEHVV
jgi:hypothetical protein